MAINIELKGTPDALAALGKAAGVDGYAMQLASAGVILKLQPKNLSLLHGGSVLASTALNTEALNMLIEGKLAPYSAENLSEKLKVVYTEAVDALVAKGALAVKTPDVAGIVDTGAPMKTPTKELKGTLHPQKNSAVEMTMLPTGMGSAQPAGKLSTSAQKSLLASDKLYDAVTASSAGSCYHTCAIADGLQAAVRVKMASNSSWTISVRFEGKKLSAYAERLEENDIKVHGSYASQHLNGNGGAPLARRAFAALLMGTGIPFTQIASKADVFFNAGV